MLASQQPITHAQCESGVSTSLKTSINPLPTDQTKATTNDEQPKLTIQQIDPSIAVRPQNRQRAITYLQEMVQKSGSNEDPIEIESKIFEATKSILYEYINALCHKRVLLENTHKRTVGCEFQPIGPSRKRKADKLARNLPEPKKHKTTPYFQWFYNNNEYTSVKLSIRDNEVLESHFLNGPSQFSHQFEFDRVPKQVDLEKLTVDGEEKIFRKLFVLERELMAPNFWTPKQSNIFHSFDLDPVTSDRYKEIAEKFLASIPNATINFIRQLQHIVNYQRYSFERNRILLLGDFDGREHEGEKLLYFGSNKTVPRTIILDRDGFDCLNSNHTAHFYEDPYFADKEAFVIVNAQTRAQNCQKKQVLAALVLTGNSNEMDPESTLKRPPRKHTVNGMDQIYDSSWRTKTANGIDSKEYLIQNKFQAYAAFLIDYSVPGV